MASQHLSQSLTPHGEDAPRALDVSRETFQVGEALPSVCTVADVAKLLGVSTSRVHHMRKDGQLNRFLLSSLGDRKARFSGRLLMAWRDGTLDVAPGRARVFGGVRRS